MTCPRLPSLMSGKGTASIQDAWAIGLQVAVMTPSPLWRWDCAVNERGHGYMPALVALTSPHNSKDCRCGLNCQHPGGWSEPWLVPSVQVPCLWPSSGCAAVAAGAQTFCPFSPQQVPLVSPRPPISPPHHTPSPRSQVASYGSWLALFLFPFSLP